MFYGYQICSRHEEGGCYLLPSWKGEKKQKMLDEGLDPNDFDENDDSLPVRY
jgi:hypothetical protein